LLLLHVPPVVASDKVIEDPVVTVVAPVMDATDGVPFTVITCTTVPQELANVIRAVPAATPVTIPDADPTVATVLLLLDQR
jgi:hypothetical protein